MQEPTILDKAFHVIMRRMVETGQAPFYTELASGLGLSVEEGRKTLHDLYMIKLFSGSYFTRRMDPDYVSHMFEYMREMGKTMKEIGKSGPFWRRPKQ